VNVGVIPLRAGSKGIPGKNKKDLVGRPLFAWALTEAIASSLDKVIVYTDDEEIVRMVRSGYAEGGKAVALRRPDHTATDGSSTESALAELVREIDYGFDTITLLQATSPLTQARDIDRALDAVSSGGFDSSLTVVREKRFHWSEAGRPLDYDPSARPRRQDFPGQLTENGAVYVTSREAFRSTGTRVSGKIAAIEMDPESLVEIDEPGDWTVVEALAERRLRSLRTGAPQRIRVLFLDVDGVLTDGRVAVGREGEATKDFSLIDGMGIELARKAGIEIVVMTKEDGPIAGSRMTKLGIERFFPGTHDKFAVSGRILSELGLSRAQSACLGDDVNDLACLLSSGLSFCPADARTEARRAADIALNAAGGRGAAREACDYLRKFNSRWEA
jgi:YrbI family 3-deoxy-D-manno-octulosonate 8-phosphate phosphatase